jgi:small subunit ribosomal protein S17
MTEQVARHMARRHATKVGTVTSDRMTKSVVVRVDRTVVHDEYRRYVRRSARFLAHDEHGTCKVGDRVEIVECRPMSARKRWRVRRVLRRAEAGDVALPADDLRS